MLQVLCAFFELKSTPLAKRAMCCVNMAAHSRRPVDFSVFGECASKVFVAAGADMPVARAVVLCASQL
jgi:hypothetical protein